MALGGPEETGRLLEHKFDYIFFTGEGSPGQCPGGARPSESRSGRPWGEEAGAEVGSAPDGNQPGLWALQGWEPGAAGLGADLRWRLGHLAKVS